MDIDEIFPSKYLRGSDLQGHAVTVQIDRVSLEKFFDQNTKTENSKPVCYFVNKSKGLILGKTLAFSIAEILGSTKTDTWQGKEIVLYSERRLVYGVEKDVIRARGKG